MRFGIRGFVPLSTIVLAAVVALVLSPVSSGRAASRGRASSPSRPAFGHAVVVDHQRVTGEPSLSISPTLNKLHHHDIYVSAPYGFSTTASFVWKSQDGGQTFHLIGDEAPPTGKPASTCAGGGDSTIVNDKAGNLYFGDLQGLTNVSESVSTDGGERFTTTCNAANDTGSDRPWNAVYGNPLKGGREYMTVDQVAQCTPPNCGLGQTGSNMLELTQTSGAAAAQQVFSPIPAQKVEPDGIVSGAVVNQRTGALYLAHTGFTNAKGKLLGGSDNNGNDNAVIVDRFPHGYKQSTPTPFTSISLCRPYNKVTPPCTSDTAAYVPPKSSTASKVTVGQDFTPIAIDRAGDLYVVWSQAPVNSSGQDSGPSTVYLAVSSNGGATWTKPINVSAHVPGPKTNIFPWVAAGSRGRVDIVWYGTPTLGKCPKQPCGPSAIKGVWNVYMAQALNAVNRRGKANPKPTFRTTKVTEYSPHYGAICTMGIGCSTGGDRGLLDFLQVQVAPNGAAYVVWADGANNDFNGGETSALIDFAQQVSGPSLYGGSIKAPAPRFGSAPGSKAAYFAGLGKQTPAGKTSNLRLLRSSLQKGRRYYTVKMKIASLRSLAPNPNLGGQDLIWMTRWELPTAHPTQQNQGHVFYAAMESDNGAKPTFYAGASTCGVASDHCKFINYPSTHTIKGSYSKKTGTITLRVPVADVGRKPRAKLYSVTGVTATQTEPSSSGKAIFNVIDSTQPYDVGGR
jgi:hypothetical protein